MTSPILQHYCLMVEFLCHMLGPDYEIVLYDLGLKQPSVIAIGNGRISGRTVGAPLSGTAMQLIAEKAYENTNWKLNYQEVSFKGRILRCSTLFIKDKNGTLEGMLCINFDDSRYRKLSEKVFSLCHPDEYTSHSIATSMTSEDTGYIMPSDVGAIQGSIMAEAEAAIISVVNAAGTPADRMNQEERMKIIRLLDEKGIFMRKGAVSIVAEKLFCSKASIYRYLSSIHGKD